MTALRLVFSAPLDPAGAFDPSAFVLRPKRRGPAVRVRSATPDAAGNVTLRLARPVAAPATFRLVALAARLRGATGGVLDGNGDGIGGDDAVRVVAVR